MRRRTLALTLALAAAALPFALLSTAGGPHGDAVAAPPGDRPIPADVGETTTTKSGLKYCVLAAGKPDGVRPKPGDLVRCNYTGWTTDGKIFDASMRHGGAAKFTVGQLIAGWNEALELMTAGARWKLTIPPDIAYGERGAGSDIPPNATLIFELELLEVIAMPRFTAPVAAAQKTTASGLKYEVLAAGAGAAAAEGESVEIRYAFWNTSGKLIDCTERSGQKLQMQPADMPLPCLKEAVAMMPAGAVWRLEAPAALGFGARGAGPDLPANSVSIWEIEVLRVVKALPLPAFVMPAAENLKKTASGLQYEVVKEGAGASPKRGDTVTVHYAGWLTDGTLFDSSYGRGFETSFRLDQVIQGWTEGVQLMKPGAVYRFVIPSNLAYGGRAVGDKIKPNSTLVFHIQLVKVGE